EARGPVGPLSIMVWGMARALTAGRQGIYVGVMLFEGFGLHLSPAPDHVEGHPFFAANNVNGVGIGSIADYQVLPPDPRPGSRRPTSASWSAPSTTCPTPRGTAPPPPP